MPEHPEGLVVAGSLTPLEHPQYYRISRNSGGNWQKTWRGLYWEVQKLASQLRSNPEVTEVEYRQNPGEPLADVTATYGTNPLDPEEVPVDNVELTLVQAHESIFTSVSFASISDFRAIYLVGIRDRLSEYAKDKDTTEAAFEAELEVRRAGMTAQELAALQLLLLGQDSYEIALPVVVHSRTVSRNFHTKLSLATTGLVFTTPQVIEAVGVPELFVIPALVNGLSARTGFTLGWKKNSQMSWLANGNGQLVETYTFRAWSTGDFGLYQIL